MCIRDRKQRVAIARALIKGADIILADEPTGNLDAENTMKVMDILKEISRTKLVVIVTHEITLIKKYADSYIKLVDGKLDENTLLGDVFEYDTERNNIYVDEKPRGEAVSYTHLISLIVGILLVHFEMLDLGRMLIGVVTIFGSFGPVLAVSALPGNLTQTFRCV